MRAARSANSGKVPNNPMQLGWFTVFKVHDVMHSVNCIISARPAAGFRKMSALASDRINKVETIHNMNPFNCYYLARKILRCEWL